MEHHCDVTDGWAGIAAALAAAAPGETVRIMPGLYAGTDTLSLPGGVTVGGAGAVLRHSGQGPALAARSVSGVVLRGLSIESAASGILKRETPDGPVLEDADEVPTEWGLLWFDDVTDSRIEKVAVTGVRAERWLRGIVIRHGSGIVLTECTAADCGGSAISFVSTRAHAAGCMAKRSQGTGISCFRSRSTMQTCDVPLTGNCCHDNAGDGIGLFSSTSETVEGNACWGNGVSGIVLQHDTKSPGEGASARLTGNRCHDNAGAGIALFSSTSEAVEGNECWGNGGAASCFSVTPKAPAKAPLPG